MSRRTSRPGAPVLLFGAGVILALAACAGKPAVSSSSPSAGPAVVLPTAVISISAAGDTPEGRVVRAWADALDADQDTVAAGYMARVVDVGNGVVLRTRTRILGWVTAFPCRLVVGALVSNNEFVTMLATSGGSRKGLTCLSPVGASLTYQVRVHDGNIVSIVLGGPSASPAPSPAVSASPSP